MLDAGAVPHSAPAPPPFWPPRRRAAADAETAAVVGAGVNGKAAARTFLARGRDVAVLDVTQRS